MGGITHVGNRIVNLWQIEGTCPLGLCSIFILNPENSADVPHFKSSGKTAFLRLKTNDWEGNWENSKNLAPVGQMQVNLSHACEKEEKGVGERHYITTSIMQISMEYNLVKE